MKSYYDIIYYIISYMISCILWYRDILVSITFLPHVNDLNVALLNSLRQTLVQVVVHIIQVEVWVMKDLLDKLFDGLQGRKSKSIGSIGSNMLKYTRDTFLWFDSLAQTCWNTPGTPSCGLLSILDLGSSYYKGCSWKRDVAMHTTPGHVPLLWQPA